MIRLVTTETGSVYGSRTPMIEDINDRLKRVEREIRESQARQQQDWPHYPFHAEHVPEFPNPEAAYVAPKPRSSHAEETAD